MLTLEPAAPPSTSSLPSAMWREAANTESYAGSVWSHSCDEAGDPSTQSDLCRQTRDTWRRLASPRGEPVFFTWEGADSWVPYVEEDS